jgi:chitinase
VSRRRAPPLLIGCLSLVMVACGSGVPFPTDERLPAFRIVGYVTDTGPTASDAQLLQLTHVNYAFALPQADGALLPIANPWKLEQYVTLAHDHDIKILISVGGWGWDDQFERLAAGPESRARFVSAVTELVAEFELDGADIDWEYPDPGASSGAFTALMTELRAALPAGKLLTAAVAAVDPAADGISTAVFGSVDFLNLMAYDGSGAQHAPMSYAQDSIAYWEARGLAAGQRVLGVPFYSRPQEVSYRDLVAADPAAAGADEIDYHTARVNYNGPQTMGRKTELAMAQASGIMIWTVVDDTTDDTSLLRAIHAALEGP